MGLVIGLGIGIPFMMGPTASDAVLAVFADGTDGFYYDFSKLTKLWKDTAGTTQVATDGDVIARADDGSGRGRNATQATSSFQPKWHTGGLARFDGVDDNLMTTLVPSASAFSILAKLTVPATISATQIALGANDSGNLNRAYLALNTTGTLGGGLGAQNSGTIHGSNDLRGLRRVLGLTFDGSTVKLYEGANAVYSAAASGAPSTTTPVYVGANNNGVSAASFSSADFNYTVAIKKALTAAEIAAITNQWGAT